MSTPTETPAEPTTIITVRDLPLRIVEAAQRAAFEADALPRPDASAGAALLWALKQWDKAQVAKEHSDGR